MWPQLPIRFLCRDRMGNESGEPTVQGELGTIILTGRKFPARMDVVVNKIVLLLCPEMTAARMKEHFA